MVSQCRCGRARSTGGCHPGASSGHVPAARVGTVASAELAAAVLARVAVIVVHALVAASAKLVASPHVHVHARLRARACPVLPSWLAVSVRAGANAPSRYRLLAARAQRARWRASIFRWCPWYHCLHAGRVRLRGRAWLARCCPVGCPPPPWSVWSRLRPARACHPSSRPGAGAPERSSAGGCVGIDAGTLASPHAGVVVLALLLPVAAHRQAGRGRHGRVAFRHRRRHSYGSAF